MMNNQEAFERSVTGLFNQGVRSFVGDVPTYHRCDGRKCAIGMLIPDELYDKEIEGRTVGSLYDDGYCYDIFDSVSRELLRELQLIHDSWSVDNWYEEFRRVGIAYDLDVEFMDRLPQLL